MSVVTPAYITESDLEPDQEFNALLDHFFEAWFRKEKLILAADPRIPSYRPCN